MQGATTRLPAAWVIAFAISCSALAVEPQGHLSVTFNEATAKRHYASEDISLQLDLTLDNATGAQIDCASLDAFALGALWMVVTDQNGIVLKQQTLNSHRSPTSIPAKRVAIPVGKSNTQTSIPLIGLDASRRDIWIRLVGTLPESTYRFPCSTETLKLAVEDEPPPSPPLFEQTDSVIDAIWKIELR